MKFICTINEYLDRDELTQFTKYLEKKYNVELSLSYSKISDVVILSKIIVKKENRGNGVGSMVMKEIVKYANENNVKIALTPSSDFGGSKSRLISFYKSFGFKPYKGYDFNETMVKNPDIILESVNFKELEKSNKYTLPKIPVSNIYLNDIVNISGKRSDADKFFSNDNYKDLPTMKISVNDIVPTQKFLNINNLKDVKNIGTNTGAYLIKFNNKYYVLDGHHRIAINILNGEDYIKSYVYDNSHNKDI